MVTWDSSRNSLQFMFVEEQCRKSFDEAWAIVDTQSAVSSGSNAQPGDRPMAVEVGGENGEDDAAEGLATLPKKKNY